MTKAVQFDSYGGVDVLEVRDVAYEHSEGWGAASTKIVISGGFGAGKTNHRLY